MPTIDEINQAAFLNRQLDMYNWAIAILRCGAGSMTMMTVATKLSEGFVPPDPPIVTLNLMPPVDDQNVLNVTADAFQMAADKITEVLTDMGFTPSSGTRKETVPAWMIPRSTGMGLGVRGTPGDALRYTSPAPPPNFNVAPYPQTPPDYTPSQPIPPQYPVNTPPPPEVGSPADPPPSVIEGQPPGEFPTEPTNPPPDQPDTTPPDIPPP